MVEVRPRQIRASVAPNSSQRRADYIGASPICKPAAIGRIRLREEAATELIPLE
jgi:hypothetical protein